MAKPCLAQSAVRGVFVKTWTGDVNRPECNVRGPWSIRHFVMVENLRLYPARVKCVGSISAIPSKLIFSASSSGDTGAWRASLNRLAATLDQTFSSSVLSPVAGESGTEIINTEVTVEWQQTGKSETMSLSIKVDI